LENFEQLLKVDFLAENRDNYISLYLDFLSYTFDSPPLTDTPKEVFIELIKNQFKNGVIDSPAKFNSMSKLLVSKGIVKSHQNFIVQKRALIIGQWVKSVINNKNIRGSIVIAPAIVRACMSNEANFNLKVKEADIVTVE